MPRLNATERTLRLTSADSYDARIRARALDERTLTPPTRYGNAQTTGVYDGAELGRTCTRDGAYQAFDCPSLFGAVRVYRRGVTVISNQ